MIRIATLDSHPTVLAGVEAILHNRSGLVHVGSAHDRYGLWPLLQRTHPDVVLLEHGPDADGLELCLRLKDRPSAPRVVLHGGGDAVLASAAFAGADALIDRSATVRELVETLREPRLPELSARQRARAAERLDHADRAILAMRLAGTSRADIAKVARIHPSELPGRLAAVAAQLAGRNASSPERRLRAAA
jgi:DNA-binding NarL/FixJ family response regulator